MNARSKDKDSAPRKQRPTSPRRPARVEEEATRIQQERLTAEEENRTLRETVFESQGRARAAEAALKRVQAEAADRDKQLRIMTDQNAELLRLLEQEEAQTSRLSSANEVRIPTRTG